ncbi:hypothetical protein HMI56_007280 [Coelomomyces lativittatus]|nr:hypothetical protein HMI56_007280 [Coelomomyces lativittatus]
MTQTSFKDIFDFFVSTYFNSSFDVTFTPIFYDKEYESASIVGLDYSPLTQTHEYVCKGKFKDSKQVFEYFKSNVPRLLEKSVNTKYFHYTFQPQVILFTSCSEDATGGLANESSAFLGFDLDPRLARTQLSAISVHANAHLTLYDEAYILLHELGHTLGSLHDEKADCDIIPYIMCPNMPSRITNNPLETIYKERFSMKSFKNISSSIHAGKNILLQWTLTRSRTQSPSRLSTRLRNIRNARAVSIQTFYTDSQR